MAYWLTLADGTKVKHGDLIKDFRGLSWRFISLTQSNSKVYVEDPDGKGPRREFFPSVFQGSITFHE